jgi:hypothetical protein
MGDWAGFSGVNSDATATTGGFGFDGPAGVGGWGDYGATASDTGMGMADVGSASGMAGGGAEGAGEASQGPGYVGLGSSLASFFSNISAPDYSQFAINPVVQQPQVAPIETRGSTTTGNAPASNVSTGPFGPTYGQITSQDWQGSPISMAPSQTAQAPTMPDLSPVSPYVSVSQQEFAQAPVSMPGAPSFASLGDFGYSNFGATPGQSSSFAQNSVGPALTDVTANNLANADQAAAMIAAANLSNSPTFAQAQGPAAPSVPSFTGLDAEIGVAPSPSAPAPSAPSPSAPSSPSEDLVADLGTGMDSGGGGAEEIFRPLETAGVNPAAQAAESATQGLALNTNALSNLANFISTQNVAVTPGVTPYVGVPATGTPAAATAPEFGSVAYPTGSTSSGSSGSGTA